MPKRKLLTLQDIASMTSILRPGKLTSLPNIDYDVHNQLTEQDEIDLDNLKSQSQELAKLILNEASHSVNLISRNEIEEALTISKISGVILTLNRDEEPLKKELGKLIRFQLNKNKP